MGQRLVKNHQLNSRLSSSELAINVFEEITNNKGVVKKKDNNCEELIVNKIILSNEELSSVCVNENIITGKSLIITIRMLKMEPIDINDKLFINPITNMLKKDKKKLTTKHEICNCQIYKENCNYCSNGINLLSDDCADGGAVGSSLVITEELINNNQIATASTVTVTPSTPSSTTTTEIINNFNLCLNVDNNNDNKNEIIFNNNNDNKNDNKLLITTTTTTKKCKQLNNINKLNNLNNNKICDSSDSKNQILINHIYNNDNDNNINIVNDDHCDRGDHGDYNDLMDNDNLFKNCNLVNNNNNNNNNNSNNNDNDNDINIERSNKNSVINNINININLNNNNNNNTLLAESNDIFNNSINKLCNKSLSSTQQQPISAGTSLTNNFSVLSSPIVINNRTSGGFLIKNNNFNDDNVDNRRSSSSSLQQTMLLSSVIEQSQTQQQQLQQQQQQQQLNDVLSGVVTPVVLQQQSAQPQACCCCKKKSPLVSLGSSKRSKCKCPSSVPVANQIQLVGGAVSGVCNSKNSSPVKDKDMTTAGTSGKTKKTNWVGKLGYGKSKNSGKTATTAAAATTVVSHTAPNTPAQTSSCVCTGYRKVEADSTVLSGCASAPLLTQQNPFNFQQHQFYNGNESNLGLGGTTNLMATNSLVPVQQIVASSPFSIPPPIIPMTTASTLFGINTNGQTQQASTLVGAASGSENSVGGNLSSSSSSASFHSNNSNTTPATTASTTTTTLLHTNEQLLQRLYGNFSNATGGGNLIVLMNQAQPLIDFARFNPDEYPIEDCDERARIQRAFEIAEGVEPPPGFIARNPTVVPTQAVIPATVAPIIAQPPITPTPTNGQHWHMLCAPPDTTLQSLLQNRFVLPNTLINPDDLPRIHSQVDYIHCLVPDLQKITGCCFYWGKMDRYEAERLLEGKPEGTFLLRDSAQEEFLFSVSFRKYGRSLHARIEQFNHKFSFDSHDPGVYTATTVTGLLEHYKDPSCVMFFEPMLTLPLNRNFCFSLQQLCRATIVSHIGYDGINDLCLPKSLKSYLKEYHYKQRVRMKRFDEQIYTTS